MARPENRKLSSVALASQYGDALRRYFLRRRFGLEDAEDAAQETLLRLLRRADLTEIENVEAYMFETAASVTVDHLRHGAARRFDAHVPFDDEFHAGIALAPDRILEGRQELERVLSALRELPERTRHVVILVRLERMRQQEVARRLGISVSAVEKHLARGVAHLATRRRG